MELKYIFYITVNSINGKFYFGVHRTNPQVFDGYIGCGITRQSQATLDIAFHRAVKKYGYDNFKRTTIKIFDTEEEAYEFEKLIVTPTLLKSKQCYNTTIGGGNDIQKKTVYQFDLNGNFIRSYKSARDAAMTVSPNNQDTIRASIKNCCLGTSYSSCGFFWSYYKEFIKKEDYQNNINRRNFARSYWLLLLLVVILVILAIVIISALGITFGGFWQYLKFILLKYTTQGRLK